MGMHDRQHWGVHIPLAPPSIEQSEHCTAVYATSTKDSSVIGVDALAAICAAVSIPVVAIGGVGAHNAHEVVEAGAAGVAVVSAVFGEANPGIATERILQVTSAIIQSILDKAAKAL